ncbi:pseudouridylate synthase RPUSD4, mitochondrial-like isoform X1 [Symsagittifera roscoffensis]|uniref:pseudouridylate synthase RPUSD4, mitochondrial-like isoform X1 n=2 Tax=Symsagittifera roscoffensis TaxID=84072 RepID=UPI00307C9B09
MSSVYSKSYNLVPRSGAFRAPLRVTLVLRRKRIQQTLGSGLPPLKSQEGGLAERNNVSDCLLEEDRYSTSFQNEDLIPVAPVRHTSQLPPKLKHYPNRLNLVTTRRDQLQLEKRDKNEFGGRMTNKMMTAHLRAGFLPQWRTEEEDACQLLLNNVVFCSKDMVAFNKPPGLAVQDGAGLKYSMDSMADRMLFLLKKTGKIKGGRGGGDDEVPKMMKVVHRLDQDVSGAIVFGLNQHTTDFLNEKFRKGEVEKTYWAICVGKPQLASHSGVIRLPLHSYNLSNGGKTQTRMRCRAKLATYINPNSDETKGQVISPVRDLENIRRTFSRSEAITKYSLVAAGIESCLLELNLLTGKKHQARVHCSEGLGCPILGDHKFHHMDKIAPQKLPAEMLRAFNIKQTHVRHLPLHLHAKTLVIPDVNDGKKLYLNTRLPTYFTENMRRLNIYSM